MIIAFSTSGAGLDDQLEGRFGRSPRFVLVDSQTDSVRVVDNHVNLNAAQGAGIQTASNLAGLGVQAVVTGHTGPKAWRVLEGAEIAVYHAQSASIRELLAAWRAGTLPRAVAADRQGHEA